MTIFKKIGMFVLETIQTIVLALSVFIIFYLFLFAPHQVKGSSMVPNFIDKDLILTSKIAYRLGQPQRGDVIVFKAPQGEPCAEIECEYIKRVIGLPGERVRLSNNVLYINGEPIDQSSFLPASYKTSPGSFLQENVEKIIPEGYYLPLGDNRPYSRDGREFGPISGESIVGKAFFRYWPLNKIGLVKHISFAEKTGV